MENKNKIPSFLEFAKQITKNAPRYAASESVKFFNDSFRLQGFNDVTFTPWPKSANPLAGKLTLYNTGNLMRSIRKTVETPNQVVIESSLIYSEIQNNGGIIIVTEKMKKFFWAKYRELMDNRSKTLKTGGYNNTKSNRNISAKAQFCKSMALKKVGSQIKIPARKFMGHSQILINNLDSFFKQDIEVKFK